MKTTLSRITSPALISLLIVAPFIVMELVNRRSFNEGFPFPLFIIMWLPVVFMFAGMPTVQNLRAGNSLMAHPITLLVRVVILVFVAWTWTDMLLDQMPCFLGVPNCD